MANPKVDIADTQKHIDRVVELLDEIQYKLMLRGINHDKSKLSEPEASGFAKVAPKLRGSS